MIICIFCSAVEHGWEIFKQVLSNKSPEEPANSSCRLEFEWHRMGDDETLLVQWHRCRAQILWAHCVWWVLVREPCRWSPSQLNTFMKDFPLVLKMELKYFQDLCKPPRLCFHVSLNKCCQFSDPRPFSCLFAPLDPPATATIRRCTCTWWTSWAPSFARATPYRRSCWTRCWSTWCRHTKWVHSHDKVVTHTKTRTGTGGCKKTTCRKCGKLIMSVK